MKRCQNDNPYYQEIVDGIFFFLGKLGGGGKSEKRIRKQKRNKEKGEVLKRENGNYIYICIKYNLPSAHPL